MHSRHSGRTRLSPMLPIGINPLPFRQNNKPTATKEELISEPENKNYLFCRFLGPVERDPNVVCWRGVEVL